MTVPVSPDSRFPSYRNAGFHRPDSGGTFSRNNQLTATSDPGKSEWRRRVERSINFDPWMEYRGMMTLDLTADAPQWELTSAAEQVREAQGEHRSLRDRYGKK